MIYKSRREEIIKEWQDDVNAVFDELDSNYDKSFNEIFNETGV